MIGNFRVMAGVRRGLVVSALLLSTGLSAQPPVSDGKKQDTKTGLIARGVTDKPVTLQTADMDNLPQKSVKVKEQGGEEITYSGATLADVMKKAGMNFEANLHGRMLTKYLLVEAADKYRVVFALPEFDPNFTDKLILVATKKDGKPLSPEQGPFRFIVPDDKRPARWIRQVRVLSLMDSVAPEEHNKKP